mmetsp:Transcript_731/g.2184  ORF Transcript_731/g.2184 Transcript_731/m.2184 type:complete len:429 (-) Transcript_731:4529-5815(-)
MMRTVAAVAAFVAVLSASHATAQSDANGVQPFLTGPHNISYFPYLKAPTLTNATNQKGLETFAVSSTFTQQFNAIQSCLPLSMSFVTANNASVTSYKFKVNSTSAEDSYNLHPYVKNKVFTVALNGTLKSSDVVNVTVTVPDDLAASITNVTAAGYSYISFAFNNVTDTDTFQAQIPATGVINLVHNPKTLFVYASTNGSALLDGNLTDVYLNVASSQPVIITNAQRLTLAKTGKGSVFIGTVSDVTTIAMTGTGAVSANSTDNLNLIQQGAGSVLASVVSQANLTYAGGKNQTRINGLGTKDAPTVATYYNSGNGTLVFTGNLVANDLLVPVSPSCLNITNFSTKPCVNEAVVAIAKNPEFPIKRPRCRNGSWILRDSEACYTKPKSRADTPGYQCETVPPVNGGYKFLFLLGVFTVTGTMIWINGL